MINQHDLETRSLFFAGSILQAAAQQFDRLLPAAVIRMADNIGQSFIDGARQTPALLSRKAHFLSQSHHRAAHYAQDLRITWQFKSKEPAFAVQFVASLRDCARQKALIRNQEHTRSKQICEQKIAERRVNNAVDCCLMQQLLERIDQAFFAASQSYISIPDGLGGSIILNAKKAHTTHSPAQITRMTRNRNTKARSMAALIAAAIFE